MKTIISMALFLSGAVLYGQTAQAPAASKGFTIDTNMVLVLFAIFLLLPIWILSNTFITAARRYYSDRARSGSARILLPIGLLMMSSSLMAQSKAAAPMVGSSASTMTMILIGVISAELMLILFFAAKTNQFLQKREVLSDISQPQPSRGFLDWLGEKWTAMNFKPLEEEHKLDTGHSYDGIRELNNVTPPWFTTAFILSILFAGVYLYRYHVAKSAPLMVEEYEIAVAKANLEHEAYLKTQASNIDETNVAVLTGADLESGKKVFTTLCAACHKADGGGMVGPNLTDDYWIHGGSLQSIFKTVKYGVPDKGMISWKEQLTPQQMAQVSNYILTLRGTNPPDAKEKQGELYVPDAAGGSNTPAAETTAAPTDTTTVK
jgi:cytochrome c oxidase cbb3-type subunit 3